MWNATCVDTFASHTVEEQPQSQEELLHMRKETRPRSMLTWPHMNQFHPVAVETCDTIGPNSRDFLRELGKRLRMVTGELRLYACLLQRIFVAIQIGNATSVVASLPVNATTSISFKL